MNKQQRALLVASVAGLVAAAGSVIWSVSGHAEESEDATATGAVPCYGINKCKGTGDCGGKGHGCAGMNTCAGQAFIDLDKDDCLRIQGGRLTAEPETKPAA